MVPAFKFSNAPAGGLSYAIIFHDLNVACRSGTGDVFALAHLDSSESAKRIPKGKIYQMNENHGQRHSPDRRAIWDPAPAARAITTTFSSSMHSTRISTCPPDRRIVTTC